MLRRIGIIMDKVYADSNRRQLGGILDEAFARRISAFVFTLTGETEETDLTAGTELLQTALHAGLLDGVLFLPYTFSASEFRDAMQRFLVQNCSLPVVQIGTENTPFPSVWFNDRAEVAEITEHLIRVHGCRNLLCLTGPATQQVSHERLAGFSDAMQEAGLPVGEDAVLFGDFWVYSARELAQEIADGSRPKPDAVVCTNDLMALSLCDALAERGISVPGDVLVTGFDGTLEAELHVPPVTTYRTSWRQLGRNAFCSLFGLISGKNCTVTQEERGTLLCRESCGCRSVVPHSENKTVSERRLEEQYLDMHISARLLSCTEPDSLIHTLFDCTFVFTDPEYADKTNFSLCLSRKTGMLEMVYTGNHKPFAAAEMIPPSFRVLDEPSVVFFTPLHFREQRFGYAALRFGGAADGFNVHYLRFCRDVCNALEVLRLRSSAVQAEGTFPESALPYEDQMHSGELTALRRRIYEHPEQNWTLAECSSQLGLSSSYFHRIYQKAFGLSCAADIRRSRMERAKYLLLHTADTLQVIAKKCGYDYAHFMRSFHSETGMTPTQFRQKKGRG